MKMKNKILNVLEFILEHILCMFVRDDTARIPLGVSLKPCFRCGSVTDMCVFVKHKPFRWQAFIECDCGFTTSYTATLYADAVKGAIEQWNHFHDEDYGMVSVYDDFS